MQITAFADCLANWWGADVLMDRSKVRCSGEVEPPTITNTLMRALLHSTKMPYEKVVEKLPGVEIDHEFARAFRYINEKVKTEKLDRSMLNTLNFKIPFSYE